jgi:hypothetical protein
MGNKYDCRKYWSCEGIRVIGSRDRIGGQHGETSGSAYQYHVYFSAD